MNLWRAFSLGWKNSTFLLRLFWALVCPLHLLNSVGAACLGMAYGLGAYDLTMVFSGVLLFFSTFLVVHNGVKRATVANRGTERQMTTSLAEGVLADFTKFRTPLMQIWSHRRINLVALLLIGVAYLLLTVRDLTGWPFELLVALAILLGFANTYLILIAALGYTWSRILRDIRQVSN
jgi:hypothetical protein